MTYRLAMACNAVRERDALRSGFRLVAGTDEVGRGALAGPVVAASIIAKVARDRWMREYDAEYPGYGFASHVGYNTRSHQQAIAQLGPSAIHRMTFQGVLSFQPSLFLRGEVDSPKPALTERRRSTRGR